MKKRVKMGIAAAAGAALGGAAIYYLQERSTPGPAYRVLRSEGDFEIRDYPAMVVAEAVVSGERKDALGKGFKLLADYIFAKSRPGQAMPMTVPVLQDAGHASDADAPMFDDTMEGKWRVRFVMLDRAIGHLPAPPEGIQLVELPPRRLGAVRFSGVANDDRLTEYEDLLRGWLTRENEPDHGEPEYAFYNSPMIPPSLRRSEVLLPLD